MNRHDGEIRLPTFQVNVRGPFCNTHQTNLGPVRLIQG